MGGVVVCTTVSGGSSSTTVSGGSSSTTVSGETPNSDTAIREGSLLQRRDVFIRTHKIQLTKYKNTKVERLGNQSRKCASTQRCLH